jgi:hypothetical protein
MNESNNSSGYPISCPPTSTLPAIGCSHLRQHPLPSFLARSKFDEISPLNSRHSNRVSLLWQFCLFYGISSLYSSVRPFLLPWSHLCFRISPGLAFQCPILSAMQSRTTFERRTRFLAETETNLNSDPLQFDRNGPIRKFKRFSRHGK